MFDTPSDSRHRESGIATTSGSGFSSLSPEIHVLASRRLAGAAFCYAFAYLVIFGIEWALLLSKRREFCTPETADIVRSLAAIVLSVAVALAAWKGKLPARSFLQLAIGYEVLGALGIVGGMWGWEAHVAGALSALAASGADLAQVAAQKVPLFEMGGVHWMGVWLLVFPLIVPLPPRRAYLSTLLTVLTLPLVLVTSQWAHGTPEILEPWVGRLYFSTLFPMVVMAGLAVFGTHIIYGLTRDLSKARQLGPYELVEKLGEGGMGEVWKAKHQLLVRPAAVKLIRPDTLGGSSSGGATAGKRFEREAQATAALASPHTIEVYDFGITRDGTFYYVMELLDGLDLKSLVEQFGSQPAPRAVHILRQASHSLMDAHESGLVHRDIKPANVFVCRRGPDFDFVKVLDFGLVKDAESAGEGKTQLTMEGVTSGTPTFMAPEMAYGNRDVDGRADLYALGCVGYWLLTGQLVFEGNSAMEILLQHARDPAPPPSTRTDMEIPSELEKVILDCLQKEPQQRPASARALLSRLDEIASRDGSWTTERAERWWRTHRPEAPSPAAGAETIAISP